MWQTLKRWKGKSSGDPTISNTGVLVTCAFGRWCGGESIAAIALDYGLHPVVVEKAFQEWATRPRNWKTREPIR